MDPLQALKYKTKVLNHKRKELQNLQKGIEKKAREIMQLEKEEQEIRASIERKIL